jgi:hypothetical protein
VACFAKKSKHLFIKAGISKLIKMKIKPNAVNGAIIKLGIKP